MKETVQAIKDTLTAHIGRIEQAAKNGIAMNEGTFEPKEWAGNSNLIPVEQCQWTLKDCAQLRRVIDKVFSQYLECTPQMILQDHDNRESLHQEREDYPK
ncbi:hypothetical protein P9911_008130 [Klebsiella oxytoca]|uniref:hypothetical protein n=1 Tax=Klebsiella oxytoca TaxID=571 RepID=UPI0025501B1E|nr:hypothetical protein [Klebsiella oxytoca]EKW3298727.1 hypothetical protein [Klebsiella oxytoca]MEC5505805.1 hypothetical protein [Klebsiella oxytoca]